MTGADVFGAFYNKLRDLREYHRKFPNLYYDQGPTDQEVCAHACFCVLYRAKLCVCDCV